MRSDATKGTDPPLLRLLSDDPIRDRDRDGLELANWAQVVAGAALGSEGPLSIGVFGRWGVGKTSVLHLARGIIDESPRAAAGEITTVMFNAWQYEAEEIPLVPLIASILQELETSKDRRDGPARQLRSALRSALCGLSAEVKGNVPFVGEMKLAFDAEKAIKRFETLRAQWIDQQMERSLYFNAFQVLREVQRTATAASRHQVVVFVDDLDRCFPDRAIRLLEGIKLVLSEPGFLFVLAVDRAVLEAYLDKRFSEEFGLRDQPRGQSYLAKFIQLPLWIPPHEHRFSKLVEHLLDEAPLVPFAAELAPMSREIGLACDHNPRQLVRFLNDLLVDEYVFRLRGNRSLFKFHSFVAGRGVRMQSESVYYGLLRSQAHCDQIGACDDLEALREMTAQALAGSLAGGPSFELWTGLQGNEHLAALLLSAPGKKWLKDGSARLTVENFLALEREVEDPSAWVDDMTERALGQIESKDSDEIVAGCHWLSQFVSPLRLRAVPRLVELAAGLDARISSEAKRTLDVICAAPAVRAAGTPGPSSP